MQGHPGGVSEPKSSIILRYITHLKSALEETVNVRESHFDIISSKWKYEAQIHTVVLKQAQIGPVRCLELK